MVTLAGSWVHPGFSVYAGPPVEAAEIASLESQAQYITRPILAMDALVRLDDPTPLQESEKKFYEALPTLTINETQRKRIKEFFARYDSYLSVTWIRRCLNLLRDLVNARSPQWYQ